MSITIEFSNGDYPSDLQYFLIGILKAGQKSRDELVELTNKPRTTLYDNLSRLITEGYVKKCSKSNGLRGRPVIYFKLAREI
jgi:predicted transcriptional regulator